MKKRALILCLVAVLVCVLTLEVMEHVVHRSVFSHMDSVPQTAQVIVAKRNLPALTVIATSDIEKKRVLMTELPAGILAGEAASLGRVLNLAVAKGQVLTESSFVPKESTDELISKLPPGMQAFTVPVRTDNVDLPQLRPGSIVDVVYIGRTDLHTGGLLQADTLLRRIVVLAVQRAFQGTRWTLDVTLQVSKREAAALELCLSKGSICLVHRAPPEPYTDPVFMPGRQLIPMIEPDTYSYRPDWIQPSRQVPKDQTPSNSPE